MFVPRTILAALILLAAPIASAQAEAPALTGTFAEKGFGYTIRYPQGWTVTRPGGYAVVIGGADNTPQSTLVVSIDNRLSPHPGEPVPGANAIFEQYLAEVRAKAWQPLIERQAPFTLGKKGRGSVGFQAVVQFNGDSARLRQWAVAIPRTSGSIVHVWTFTAPLETFDQALPTARAILDSWSFVPDEAKPPTVAAKPSTPKTRKPPR